jgi:hypothetical protein
MTAVTPCSYDMIRKCWEKTPDTRPHFSELANILSASLGEMAGYLDFSAESATTGI